MFIRTKTVRGQTYHYLVESQRGNGIPKQRVILYLGHYKSIDEAVEKLPKATTRLKRMRGRMQRSLLPVDVDSVYNRKLKSQIASYDKTIQEQKEKLELLRALQVVPNEE